MFNGKHSYEIVRLLHNVTDKCYLSLSCRNKDYVIVCDLNFEIHKQNYCESRFPDS